LDEEQERKTVISFLKRSGLIRFSFIVVVCVAAYSNALPRKSTYWVVDNVQVEGQGTDAVAAREKALVAGQRRAFEKLLELLPIQETEKQRLVQAKDAEILDLIFDFSVQDERLAPGKYRALLRYRFPKETIAKWLEANHVVLSTPTNTEKTLDNALADALADKDSSASSEHAQEPSPSVSEEYVEVSIVRFADWFAIEKTLRRWRNMYQVHSYSARWVVLRVSPQFLRERTTLQQQGLTLESVDSMWRLSCASAH
jgi:hypothetical protein